MNLAAKLAQNMQGSAANVQKTHSSIKLSHTHAAKHIGSTQAQVLVLSWYKIGQNHCSLVVNVNINKNKIVSIFCNFLGKQKAIKDS